MSAVCPSCGVAVVPGYSRCPKCKASLPYGHGRSKRSTVDPGGTSVRERGFPVIGALIVAVVITFAIVLIFGLGGTEKKKPRIAAPVVQEPTTQPQGRIQPPPPTSVPTAQPPTPPPDPNATATSLQRALQRQRLWSTVEAYGDRVDIRSASCSEPEMTTMIDAARDPLRAAGLTRVRCLAQSGTVVLERDL
jgi:hypothetical protein